MIDFFKLLSPEGKRKMIYERNTGRQIRCKQCGTWFRVENQADHDKACRALGEIELYE